MTARTDSLPEILPIVPGLRADTRGGWYASTVFPAVFLCSEAFFTPAAAVADLQRILTERGSRLALLPPQPVEVQLVVEGPAAAGDAEFLWFEPPALYRARLAAVHGAHELDHWQRGATEWVTLHPVHAVQHVTYWADEPADALAAITAALAGPEWAPFIELVPTTYAPLVRRSFESATLVEERRRAELAAGKHRAHQLMKRAGGTNLSQQR